MLISKHSTGYYVAIVLLSLLAMTFVSARPLNTQTAEKPETRCGWFSNPTPGNAWLYDRDGEWTIGVQGGYQADGDWPEFSPKQWVETNVHYGYGCACLKVQVDRSTKQVIKIESARARPLSVCRRDKALRKYDFK
ncbi:MAG TPA: DUF4087 domain-containing protein [Pyrinomonadaceae bacterium]|nr:DUF4087 domain-containing protein [Pyrinomonadaceae bacterium]